MKLLRGRTDNGCIAELKGAADRIICDPPFLSEECQTKGIFFFLFSALQGVHESNALSGNDSPLALPLMGHSCDLKTDPLHRRANGERNHRTLPPPRHRYHDFRARALEGAQQ
jgi:hypothetical protein